MIPYGHQWISPEDIAAVVETLESDWITQGPAVVQFEQAVARYCGAPYAVCVNSGTSALHLACRALDLGPGDALWTSPITFVASANCARYCGADVDFVDIDPATANLDPAALGDKLAGAKRAGRLPKILVAVHFAGQPCDMRAIAGLAREYGVAVVEDASHALGAEYEGAKIGDGRYSDATIFSFHAVKLITTGEGGMVVMNRKDANDRLVRLRSHGITREPDELELEAPPGWWYEQHELGFNYRMTDIQAALGVQQLERLEAFLAARTALAARYDRMLESLPCEPLETNVDGRSAWHLYVVRLDPSAPASRAEVYRTMREAGIGVNVHYIPVHLQPYYRQLGFSRGDFPCAEAYYESALTLPLHPQIDHAQQDRIVSVLAAALR